MMMMMILDDNTPDMLLTLLLLSQVAYYSLAGTVGCGLRHCTVASGTANVDNDAAALLQHHWRHSVVHLPLCKEVDLQETGTWQKCRMAVST
jgi:hypothetical protein